MLALAVALRGDGYELDSEIVLAVTDNSKQPGRIFGAFTSTGPVRDRYGKFVRTMLGVFAFG